MLLVDTRGRGIALDVARGLAYLHSNSVLHLDIKSPNILLTHNYTAKVADVGLARVLKTKTHLSQTMPGGVQMYTCISVRQSQWKVLV